MKRVLALLMISCLATVTAHAQGAQPSIPPVRAPVTFVLDTVLFHLPRAELAPGALVVISRRPAGARMYSRRPVVNGRGDLDSRCVQSALGAGRVVDLAPTLRTDSTYVYAIRVRPGECALAPARR